MFYIAIMTTLATH